MINQFNVEKALRDFLVSLTSFDVVSHDSDYTPNTDTTYIKEKVMLGNVSITLTPNDAENANGIHQIDIYTPLASKNKWYGLGLRDAMKGNYTKGLTAGIEQGGQKIIINEVNLPPMRINESETHRIHTLDVNFRVIG